MFFIRSTLGKVCNNYKKSDISISNSAAEAVAVVEAAVTSVAVVKGWRIAMELWLMLKVKVTAVMIVLQW